MNGPFIYIEDGVYDGTNIKYLPYRWAICSTCHGEGTRRMVSEEYIAEMDEDEREDLRAGRYDIACDECHGTGKIKVIDVERCSPEDLEEYRSQEQDRIASEYEAAAERRMGA